MDLATIFGILAFGGLVYAGIVSRQLTDALVNMHGVFVVLGGTFVAMLLNTPLVFLVKALRELFLVMFREGGLASPEKIVPVMVELAEQCRMRGMTAMKDVDTRIGDGFLSRAAVAALEYNDAQFVRKVLEQEINQGADITNEVANVYRSMGVLAPMFGLIGTLLGIIGVLKELSNPEVVGPAMAVAITSAFYGILFSNMFCVPVAGKIRARIWMEVRIKSMIMEGVLEIMKGSIPLVVERRMQSFL